MKHASFEAKYHSLTGGVMLQLGCTRKFVVPLENHGMLTDHPGMLTEHEQLE